MLIFFQACLDNNRNAHKSGKNKMKNQSNSPKRICCLAGECRYKSSERNPICYEMPSTKVEGSKKLRRPFCALATAPNYSEVVPVLSIFLKASFCSA